MSKLAMSYLSHMSSDITQYINYSISLSDAQNRNGVNTKHVWLISKGKELNCETRSGNHISAGDRKDALHRSYVIPPHAFPHRDGCVKDHQRIVSLPSRIDDTINTSTARARRAAFPWPQLYLNTALPRGNHRRGFVATVGNTEGFSGNIVFRWLKQIIHPV